VARAGIGGLGVVLQPAHKVELLLADFPRLALIAADFSGPSEGRGYSQARILREQWKFGGELLRATGYVRRDQLIFMARLAASQQASNLPDADPRGRRRPALATFSWAYQPSNDTGLPLKLAAPLSGIHLPSPESAGPTVSGPTLKRSAS